MTQLLSFSIWMQWVSYWICCKGWYRRSRRVS